MRALLLSLLLAVSSTAQERENLILCMGISNMAGPNSALYLIGSPIQYRPTTRCWNPQTQQLEGFYGWNAQGFDRSRPGNFGPDVGIAKAMEIKYRRAVIVKLATPASPLIAGNHPTAPSFDPAATELWPQVVAEIQAVDAAVRAEGKSPHWAELFWIGWETDANQPNGYGAKFAQLVSQLRTLTNSPRMSVTIERPMRHPLSAWSQAGMESIQEACEDLALRDPFVRVVDLEPAGLIYRQDLNHREPSSSVLEGCLLGLAATGVPLFTEIR